jgi:very-short-patch-repair endonuclease
MQTYEYYYKEHWTNNKSVREIATLLGTYPNKVAREMDKLGVPRRSYSEAQKVALATGKNKHPTKGKKHSAETRVKISERLAEEWAGKTPEEKAAVSKRNKEIWKNLTEEQKSNIRSASAKAIRRTSDEGSKLEKIVAAGLEEAGYVVDFHKDHLLANQKLQLDILLPELSLAIEIDGPTHFEPIWGQEALLKTIRADNEKNGLLISCGIAVLRVKHIHKKVTRKVERDTLRAVLKAVKDFEAGDQEPVVIIVDPKE